MARLGSSVTNEIKQALAASRGALRSVAAFSGVINLLMLVPLGVGLVALVLLLVFKRGMFIGPRTPRYDGPAQPLGAGESAASIVRAPMFWVVVGLMALYTLSLFFAL